MDKELLNDFENDNLSISQIAEKWQLSWDVVQKLRAKRRKSVGLSPLNRSRKSGFESN